MIKRSDLPTGTKTCAVCGRIVTMKNPYFVARYDDEGHTAIVQSCRPCATRLDRDGLTTVYHGDNPVTFGPRFPLPSTD